KINFKSQMMTALRLSTLKSQRGLARRIGRTSATVSELLSSPHTKLSTLCGLAAELGYAVEARLVPFSRVLNGVVDDPPKNLRQEFGDVLDMIERSGMPETEPLSESTVAVLLSRLDSSD